MAGMALGTLGAVGSGCSTMLSGDDERKSGDTHDPTPIHDPRSRAEGQVKMVASLDDGAAYWSYAGVVYAVRPNLRPLPILRIAGCQVHWTRPESDGAYRMKAKTLTFFRHAESGAFLDQYDNPFTEKRNLVRPNIFSGKGGAIFPADGTAMRLMGTVDASESAPRGFSPGDSHRGLGRVEWSLTHDSSVLLTDHAFNVQVQPQLEAHTRTADRSQFFDPRVKRLPARYAATTITPWLAWMEMGATQGHLVWHTSGEKVFSEDRLPEDYRVRAGAMLEQLFASPGFSA
jgi:hypothetical protein